jgi:hypothetical protein
MKIIVLKHPENVRAYRRSTNGYHFKGIAKDQQDFYNKVTTWESQDIFTMEDGVILDQSQNEVFNPASPDSFDFYDYTYAMVSVESLNHYDDAALIRAIEVDNLYESEEVLNLIKELVL